MKFLVTMRQDLRYYVEAEDDEEAVEKVTMTMCPADAFSSSTIVGAVVEQVDTTSVN